MGLFLAYAPFNLAPTMSGSRLLAMLDPLLPYGFMLRLLKGKCNLKTKIIVKLNKEYIGIYFLKLTSVQIQED